MGITVTLPYDPEWQALGWAKIHCPSYITNDIHSWGAWEPRSVATIDYYFSDPRDAAMFALRWL